MKLSNNLKVKRFNKNQITQDELAKQLHVSRQTIHAIENGKFNPSVTLALKLAEFFDCQVEEIFYLNMEEQQND
jgi:putative transcriptional regulator